MIAIIFQHKTLKKKRTIIDNQIYHSIRKLLKQMCLTTQITTEQVQVICPKNLLKLTFAKDLSNHMPKRYFFGRNMK